MGRKNKKRQAKRAAERKQAAAATVESKYSHLKGKLFDTSSPALDCHHGALPPSCSRRHDAALLIGKYFEERFELTGQENNILSLNYINYRFLVHNREAVGVDTAALVLHDAANHALQKSYKIAQLLVHLHIWLDKWLRAGKPPVPFFFCGNDETEGLKSPIWTEIMLLENENETPGEICDYIHKHLPCGCLKETKKAATHAVSHTICQGCNKTGSHNDFMVCSGCRGASYCSRECQVAHWDDHRGPCRATQGKKVSKEDLHKLFDEMMEKSKASK